MGAAVPVLHLPSAPDRGCVARGEKDRRGATSLKTAGDIENIRSGFSDEPVKLTGRPRPVAVQSYVSDGPRWRRADHPPVE
jgi:hypothetical protein